MLDLLQNAPRSAQQEERRAGADSPRAHGVTPDLGRDVEGGLRSQAQVVELFLDGQSGVDYCLPRRGNLL